jgi:hypothetical protein
VNYAAAHGVVVVAAAGNNSNATVTYPASYDHVISVGSTTRLNQRAPYSNFNPYVDIAAPGGANSGSASQDIYSTTLDNNYGLMAGTSMASPQVAGVAALVWSAGHATTAPQVAEALLCSALDLGTVGRDESYGYGLVQADAAVNYVPGTANCLPNIPHDDFDSPLVISGPNYTDSLDATHATSWLDDPMPCAGDTSRTVWYRYSASAAGMLSLDTFGSTYNTVLSVYTGSRGSLTQIYCNNDASVQTEASALQFPVQPGQTFSIMVSSTAHEGDEGTLALHANLSKVQGCYTVEGNPPMVICLAN